MVILLFKLKGVSSLEKTQSPLTVNRNGQEAPLHVCGLKLALVHYMPQPGEVRACSGCRVNKEIRAGQKKIYLDAVGTDLAKPVSRAMCLVSWGTGDVWPTRSSGVHPPMLSLYGEIETDREPVGVSW